MKVNRHEHFVTAVAALTTIAGSAVAVPALVVLAAGAAVCLVMFPWLLTLAICGATAFLGAPICSWGG